MIQDFWRPELHQVTSLPFDDQHVHTTKPVACSPERKVHRKDLLRATTPLVVDADHQPERPLSPTSNVCDSESDSDDELYFVSSHQNLVPAVVRQN